MNGEVIDPKEQLADAFRTIQKYGGNRGDSFDIGNEGSGGSTDLTEFLSNPGKLAKEFNLNARQAENVKSAIIGAGTGLGHKYLSKTFGSIPAALFSAYLTAHLAKKITEK